MNGIPENTAAEAMKNLSLQATNSFATTGRPPNSRVFVVVLVVLVVVSTLNKTTTTTMKATTTSFTDDPL